MFAKTLTNIAALQLACLMVTSFAATAHGHFIGRGPGGLPQVSYGNGYPPGAFKPQRLRDYGHDVLHLPTPPGAGAYDHPTLSKKIRPIPYIGPHRGYWHAVGPYYSEDYNRPRTVLRGERDPNRHRYEKRRYGPIRRFPR